MRPTTQDRAVHEQRWTSERSTATARSAIASARSAITSITEATVGIVALISKVMAASGHGALIAWDQFRSYPTRTQLSIAAVGSSVGVGAVIVTLLS